MIDVPAAVLAVVLLGGVWICYKAQQREDFDFADMLRDDAGKPSALRLGVIVAIAMSSWALAYDTINGNELDIQVFVAYLVIWSGAKIAEKLIDIVAAKWLPKGAS